MFYNEIMYHTIEKAIEMTGFIIEEFLIGEGYVSDVADIINVYITEDRTATILYVVSIVNPENFLCIFENQVTVSLVQSPGEFKTIQEDSLSNYSVDEIEYSISRWLKRIQIINHRNKLKSDNKIGSNISKFIKKIDESEITDNELLSENEINQVTKLVKEMEETFQKNIDNLKEDYKNNEIEINLLNEELKYVKNELSKIRIQAKSVPKKKWAKDTYISLQRMLKKYPNTTMYLTLGGLNPEIPVSQKLIGAGLAFLSDEIKSDVSASDIYDQQK
ncbi:hypothetical protein [Enterococcus alishanensis]